MEKTRDEGILQILDAPITERMYITICDVDDAPEMTIVFNRQTYVPFDTLDNIYHYDDDKLFLSKDETKIYNLISDSDGIYFRVISTDGNVINDKIKCGNLGPFNRFYTNLNDSKIGLGVVSFEYSERFESLHYVVCDPEENINYEPIYFPRRSEAYLSPDAKNVIIEEVQFIDDEDPNTPVEYRPGNVFIYDAKTAVLKKQIKLPPEGEILLFQNYPEQLYYLQSDSSQPIITVDLTSGIPVKLINSQGQLLQGGTLKYYEGGWKDAEDHGDGTFTVDTEKSTISLRMTYAYASQDMNNVTVGSDTITFQTVNSRIELQNSQNQLMDEGTVKYYAGGWRDLGVTSGGVAMKELLPGSYPFRMTYDYASNDKTQDIGTDPTVVFATVPAQVELRDSQNQLMDGGTVQYYSGGWRTFGATSGGVSVKELLPNSYSFRMTYGFASNDKSQDVSLDPTVVFETVPVQVELRDSQNQLMDEGTVKYYSGGWRDFGVTSSGVSVKELLPNNYAFRMTYAYASNDKNQDVSLDPTVVFPTVSIQVELKDSQNQLMDGGTVQYYSGGWRIFGATSGGVALKELLPNSYPFRMTYGFASLDLTQDIRATPTVTFQTVSAKVELRDSQDRLMDQGTVQYYSGGWRDFGVTSGGVARKELLAKSYPFRLEYAYVSTDQEQNLLENETVLFETVRTVVRVKNAQGELVDGATVRYYSGGWRDFGITSSGVADKELLPKTYPFRVIYSGVQKDVEQDVSANPIVEVTFD
jgi:hypothetical protein